MPANVTLAVGTLYAFLLVLARVGGALIFVPLPGIKGVPQPARAALALGFTLALYSRWPVVNAEAVTGMRMAGWAAAEAAVGIAIGVSVAIALEAFALAAQILGLQAGYAYASTIDPNTEADSGILLVFAQLVAGINVHGVITKPAIGVNYAFSDRLALYAQVGKTYSVNVAHLYPERYRFDTTNVGLGLTYRFSLPGA